MKGPSLALSFLNSDSEIGEIMRRHDWADSGLGDPVTWPQTLKSKLNTVLNSSFPMYLLWGEDLICFYNDAFRKSLGEEGKHPAIGKKAKDVWLETWSVIGPLVEGVMTTGKAGWFEDKQIRLFRDGKVEDVYWTFSYSPVASETGDVCGVLVICNETTEKVRLLAKLEESNRLYSFAIEASELGTWDFDLRTRIFNANYRLKKWFGLDPADHMDPSLAVSRIVDKDRERVAGDIQNALKKKGGGLFNIQFSIENPVTGQLRKVKAVGKVMFDDTEEAYSFNGTVQDITAEVAAQESSQKLSILVENSVDLMAILRMDGKNSYINSAGRTLLGVDEHEDVTLIPISEFHTPEQLAYVQAEILPSVMNNGTWTGTFGIRNRKTGEIIPLQNNCHRIDDERTGEPIGVGTVMRDIRFEVNSRQKLEEEVKRRTEELIRVNKQLERKNKDLSSFAFVSSHDLQEPLRKIRTFVSRIEENSDLLSGKNLEYFERIKGSATRMQVLIKDLLNFSRVSDTEISFEETNLDDVLKETLVEYRQLLEAHSGTVTSSALPVLRVVPFQVQQLFNNIIGNAIKFARTDIPLKITVHADITEDDLPDKSNEAATYHRITIQDNGIGFEPEYREKIFEVFQRLHGRGMFEGTGIGLSICKKIMENHHGYITANSERGKGATFELCFPGVGR